MEADLSARYRAVRQQSERLCAPLETEDMGVQPMDDASPPKWHLAHTAWFFETFILSQSNDYAPFDPRFEYLFNSYYNGVGEQYPRPRRGHLSRPTVAEVMDYRAHVDEAMLKRLSSGLSAENAALCALGLNHEQQHQELILTDLKYGFGHNPLHPAYCDPIEAAPEASPQTFVDFAGGMVSVGLDAGAETFKFDNECPRHPVFLKPYALSRRLVTNGEFEQFIADGGYDTPALWLSEGWTRVQAEAWHAPLYWHETDDGWLEYRLDGLKPLDPHLPVTHVSAHEAFAFASWSGARLPSEFEWEAAAAEQASTSTSADAFVESGRYHPTPSTPDASGLDQMGGCAWQWTGSAYAPYPGFKPLPGTLGEYNGKFMSSQLVLRGGSCATPRDHLRPSYRNFFYPPDRWQFSGIRLARDSD